MAVFCDGDFWHGKGWDKRGFKSWEEQFNRLQTSEFWKRKIGANMERDKRVNRELELQDWLVLRYLESEILDDVEMCATSVESCIALRGAYEKQYAAQKVSG